MKGREGQQLAITQVGASNRNSRVGIPELIAGRGVTVQAVAVSDEEKPLPRRTDMQRLAEVSDWSAVNIEGRVLEVLVGGHFKLVDESGLAVRVHVDRPQIPKLQEGQSCQVLLATKSTRYSNVSVTGFSAILPGRCLAQNQCLFLHGSSLRSRCKELAGVYASVSVGRKHGRLPSWSKAGWGVCLGWPCESADGWRTGWKAGELAGSCSFE